MKKHALLPEDLSTWHKSKSETLLNALACPTPGLVEKIRKALKVQRKGDPKFTDSFVVGLTFLVQLKCMQIFDTAIDIALVRENKRNLTRQLQYEIPIFPVVSWRNALEQKCIWDALEHEEHLEDENILDKLASTSLSPPGKQKTSGGEGVGGERKKQCGMNIETVNVFGLLKTTNSSELTIRMIEKQQKEAQDNFETASMEIMGDLVSAAEDSKKKKEKKAEKKEVKQTRIKEICEDLDLCLREIGDICQFFPSEESFLEKILDLPPEFEFQLREVYEKAKLRWADSQFQVCFLSWMQREVAKKDRSGIKDPNVHKATTINIMKLMTFKLSVVPWLSMELQDALWAQESLKALYKKEKGELIQKSLTSRIEEMQELMKEQKKEDTATKEKEKEKQQEKDKEEEKKVKRPELNARIAWLVDCTQKLHKFAINVALLLKPLVPETQAKTIIELVEKRKAERKSRSEKARKTK